MRDISEEAGLACRLPHSDGTSVRLVFQMLVLRSQHSVFLLVRALK